MKIHSTINIFDKNIFYFPSHQTKTSLKNTKKIDCDARNYYYFAIQEATKLAEQGVKNVKVRVESSKIKKFEFNTCGTCFSCF